MKNGSESGTAVRWVPWTLRPHSSAREAGDSTELCVTVGARSEGGLQSGSFALFDAEEPFKLNLQVEGARSKGGGKDGR